MGLLVDDAPLTKDLYGLAAVALMGRHEFDDAVALPVVVPVHKAVRPVATFLLARVRTPRVIRAVLCCPEQRT